MSTGTTISTSALRKIGVIGKSVTAASGVNLDIALEALNNMLTSWANTKAMINSITTETFPFVAAQAAYTTAVLSAGRPVALDYMYITLSGVSYPCEIINNQSFDDIGYKPATGIPTVCYYDAAYPTGTMTFFPIPYSASLSCVVDTQRVLTGVILAGTTVALPPGYEKAIIDNLAVYLGTDFPGAPVSALLQSEAKEGRRVLKVTNYTPLISRIGWNAGRAYPPTQWLPPW